MVGQVGENYPTGVGNQLRWLTYSPTLQNRFASGSAGGSPLDCESSSSAIELKPGKEDQKMKSDRRGYRDVICGGFGFARSPLSKSRGPLNSPAGQFRGF